VSSFLGSVVVDPTKKLDIDVEFVSKESKMLLFKYRFDFNVLELLRELCQRDKFSSSLRMS